MAETDSGTGTADQDQLIEVTAAAPAAGNGTGFSCSFLAPDIQDNPTGWGPAEVADSFRDMPYQPFSKGDRLGKISDWTAVQDKKYASMYIYHTLMLIHLNMDTVTDHSFLYIFHVLRSTLYTDVNNSLVKFCNYATNTYWYTCKDWTSSSLKLRV